MIHRTVSFPSVEATVQALLESTVWHTDDGAYLKHDTIGILISTWDTADPELVHMTLTVTTSTGAIEMLDGLPIVLKSEGSDTLQRVNWLDAQGGLFYRYLPRGKYLATVIKGSGAPQAYLPPPLDEHRVIIFPELRGVPKSAAASASSVDYQIADIPLRIKIVETLNSSSLMVMAEDPGLDGAIATWLITSPESDAAQTLLTPLAWDPIFGFCEARLNLRGQGQPFKLGLVQGLCRLGELPESMAPFIRESVLLAQPYTRQTWRSLSHDLSLPSVTRSAIINALGAKV